MRSTSALVLFIAFGLIFIHTGIALGAKPLPKDKHWVGTWCTATQLVEPNNMPPAPGLAGNTLRQVVRVSIGGNQLRVKFSNEHSKSPVSMKSVQIALSKGGSDIDAKTLKVLTFNGSKSATMESGKTIYSDPIAFNLKARADVAITICFEQTSETLTGHPGSRTTSYLLPGNDLKTTDFTKAITTEHWYVINAIDVVAPKNTGTIAILGNSITDGRGTTTNAQNRWPDILSERLLKNPGTQNIGVLNMGIGGNCVLRGGLGPTGISRYERDIINQPGVRWAIVFIGVNDLGGVRNEASATTVSDNLIGAYKSMIDQAHAKGIRIYGATIMPFKGNGYYNTNSETARQKVNQWIRESKSFDGVIDFEKVLQNPEDPAAMLSTLDFQNDFLHPSAEGHALLGQSIDLKFFTDQSFFKLKSK